jgi:hypothetical protein
MCKRMRIDLLARVTLMALAALTLQACAAQWTAPDAYIAVCLQTPSETKRLVTDLSDAANAMAMQIRDGTADRRELVLRV